LQEPNKCFNFNYRLNKAAFMPKIKTSREEILEKATLVFQQYGYPNTSIKMLAEACGLQKAHFYYYFENKEALMLAVLEYVFVKIEKELIAIAWQEEKSRAKRLQEFLTVFERLFYESGEGKLMVNTILQTLTEASPFKSIAKKLYQQLNEALAELYQDRYSPSYAVGKAQQALQDLQGGLIMSQIHEDSSFFKAALKRVGKKIG
jgi:TetR/AcrR family transcriptional repressor of nem operon